jgi:carbon-monoxide dehydrogenase medium subunit
VAVQLTINGETCTAARIGLTNVATQPIRATTAETALIGRPLNEETIRAAGAAAAQDCDPSVDLRGSVEYKRDLVRVITMRAIRKALSRAKGATVNVNSC